MSMASCPAIAPHRPHPMQSPDSTILARVAGFGAGVRKSTSVCIQDVPILAAFATCSPGLRACHGERASS